MPLYTDSQELWLGFLVKLDWSLYSVFDGVINYLFAWLRLKKDRSPGLAKLFVWKSNQTDLCINSLDRQGHHLGFRDAELLVGFSDQMPK